MVEAQGTNRYKKKGDLVGSPRKKEGRGRIKMIEEVD